MEVYRDRRRLNSRRGHVLRALRWNLTTLKAFWATDFRFDEARNDCQPSHPGDLRSATYATHKHSHVNAWLTKYPYCHLDFTSTSNSWLNLVERWFREITDRAMRRGVCCSMPDPWDPRGRSKADLR